MSEGPAQPLRGYRCSRSVPRQMAGRRSEGPDFRETCPDPRAEPHFFFARRFQIKSSQAAPNVRQNKQHIRNHHSWQSKTCAKSHNSHHVFKTEQKCANEVLSTHDSSLWRTLQPWSIPAGIPGMSRIQGALMMIVDTRAEIHVVCARHRNMLDDNISLNEAIALDGQDGGGRSEQCDVSTWRSVCLCC